LAFAQASLAIPDTAVATVAVEQVAALGTANAARALAAALDQQLLLRVRWTIVDELRAISGQKHRLDARAWKAWADGLAPDWTPAKSAVDSSDQEPATVTFAGLPIRSDRIAFLIDLSGSMWKNDEGGKTRKEIVDAELARALGGLDARAQFNVIPFTDAPIPWQPKLAPATPENVKRALAFFTGRRDQGKGNYWDAMELALADPEVDTIVVLGDGAPSGGRRWNLELMKSLFAERNRYRKVAVDAALVGASGFLERQWTELCEASHGRAVRAVWKN
jgi:hypothetical protein